VISKRSVLDEAEHGMWRGVLRRTPAILSTWPTLFARTRDQNIWIVNISQEYVTPFARSRSINIIHDLIQIDYPRSQVVQLFYRYVVPKLVRRAALNISVSRTTAARLSSMGVPSLTVYNEFALPFQDDPPICDTKPRLYAACWIGTRLKHKNLDDYLAAAEAMPARSFALIMPQADAQSLSASAKFPCNISVFHSLGAAEYRELLKASDFLVSTSLAEGFGRPPAEGALAGCDLVLSDIPIYRELYEGLAHFYRPGDVAGLVTALSKTRGGVYRHALSRFKEWSGGHNLAEAIHQRIRSSS